MNFDKELTNFHLARKNTQRKRHDEDRRKAGLNKKEKENRASLLTWLRAKGVVTTSWVAESGNETPM